MPHCNSSQGRKQKHFCRNKNPTILPDANLLLPSERGEAKNYKIYHPRV
ncbi:hypothetical protein AVDCRST_MAG84-3110 [uncultured Microcoleus sp.]|uniref:Uncharacterized protein n=1 Tax=uncultured Microcoleus sp. TaxID=259945 RepID=A0A6J4MB68_9CYAN|nr:hypothetical protein AVDCRST_MAG84-3110 [uncultured Microcoleus sp.]